MALRSFGRLACLALFALYPASMGLGQDKDYCGGISRHAWCVNVPGDGYSISVVKDPLSTTDVAQFVKSGPVQDSLVTYLLDHRHARMFLTLIKPTPEMHSLPFHWNVGLRMKSGEMIRAQKWLLARGGEYLALDPVVNRTFIPGVDLTSPHGWSFVVFLDFPDRTGDGSEWKVGKVEDLEIEGAGGIIATAGH